MRTEREPVVLLVVEEQDQRRSLLALQGSDDGVRFHALIDANKRRTILQKCQAQNPPRSREEREVFVFVVGDPTTEVARTAHHKKTSRPSRLRGGFED